MKYPSPFRTVKLALVVVASSLYLGCGGSKLAANAGGTTPVGPAIPAPAVGAYFGAQVNPAGTGSQETQTETLESQIGRTLALHMHYPAWGTGTTPSFPDSSMQTDLSLGRTPVVSWICGDTDANVAAGVDDTLIIATAQAVKQFGSPIFIRWFWEMNLNTSSNQACIGSAGAAGYIAAYQHIHTIFAAQGVTNVAWLWNPGVTPTDPDPAAYYPGATYVDWIGFDGYDKIGANDFGGVFSKYYTEFSTYGKPILIGETGECPSVQASYLALAQAEIEGQSNPGNYSFPLIKGFMYFDSPGSFTCAWNLSPAGTTAFTTMGAQTFFQAKP